MSYRARQLLRRVRRTFRPPIWATKSFEFWTLLMAMLQTLRPRGVVEFGSGRSSSYLGEYAMKTGARYVSIEESARFARRVRRALKLGLVDPAPIRIVPLRPDGWYDGAALETAIDFAPDMLFIDGPTKAAGHRSVARAMALHGKLLPGVRLLLVDDVHRRDVMDMHNSLAALMPGTATLFMLYGAQPNLIALTLPEADGARVEALAAALGIALMDQDEAERHVRE